MRSLEDIYKQFSEDLETNLDSVLMKNSSHAMLDWDLLLFVKTNAIKNEKIQEMYDILKEVDKYLKYKSSDGNLIRKELRSKIQKLIDDV